MCSRELEYACRGCAHVDLGQSARVGGIGVHGEDRESVDGGPTSVGVAVVVVMEVVVVVVVIFVVVVVVVVVVMVMVNVGTERILVSEDVRRKRQTVE